MAVSNKPTVAQPAPRPKVVAPNAADIVAAIAGRMPSESVEVGGYRWTLTIPRSCASAWAFAKSTSQVDPNTLSRLDDSSDRLTSDMAQLTIAMLAPTIAASLTMFGSPKELPEGVDPDTLSDEEKWNIFPIGQLFPLVDTRPDANPTIPRIAEFGDVELCEVVLDFVQQLPEPVVQQLASVATGLQRKYTETMNTAGAKSFQRPPLASS